MIKNFYTLKIRKHIARMRREAFDKGLGETLVLFVCTRGLPGAIMPYDIPARVEQGHPFLRWEEALMSDIQAGRTVTADEWLNRTISRLG